MTSHCATHTRETKSFLSEFCRPPGAHFPTARSWRDPNWAFARVLACFATWLNADSSRVPDTDWLCQTFSGFSYITDSGGSASSSAPGSVTNRARGQGFWEAVGGWVVPSYYIQSGTVPRGWVGWPVLPFRAAPIPTTQVTGIKEEHCYYFRFMFRGCFSSRYLVLCAGSEILSPPFPLE